MHRLAPVVLLLLLWVPAAGAWTWPVNGPVLQGFSFDPAHPYAGGQHRGIDIGADAGAPVLAPASGVVSFAGSVPSSGESVTIDTSDGLAVTLTHLGSIAVAKGGAVSEGAVVGTIGPTGTPEVVGPYVHLGVRTASDDQGYLDPLLLLPPLVPVAPVAPAPAAAAPVAAPVDVAPPVPAPAPEPAPVDEPAPAADAAPPAAADPSLPAVEPTSADAAPVDTAPPTDVTPPATPVESAPAPAPAEAAPVQTAPVEAAPVETVSATADSAEADPTADLPAEQPSAPAAPAAAVAPAAPADSALPAPAVLAQPLAPVETAAPSVASVEPIAPAPLLAAVRRSGPRTGQAPPATGPRVTPVQPAVPPRADAAADRSRHSSEPVERRRLPHRDAPAASSVDARRSRVPLVPLAAALAAALAAGAVATLRRRVPARRPAPAADVLAFPPSPVHDRERLAA